MNRRAFLISSFLLGVMHATGIKRGTESPIKPAEGGFTLGSRVPTFTGGKVYPVVHTKPQQDYVRAYYCKHGTWPEHPVTP
jgi:hypothetical protein